jgi:membrane protein implicated in regulation of membrane protease activity
MAAVHMPHPIRDHPDAGRAAIDVFWVLAIGVIAAYAFFAALGAFSPGDVLGLTIAVGVLLLLWIARAALSGRRARNDRDPRLVHARERRGF